MAKKLRQKLPSSASSSRRTNRELEDSIHQIAIFVRKKRRALSYTQEELSQRAGVGLRFLKELETGKTSLRLDKVQQVLEFLGATLLATEIKNISILYGAGRT